MRPRPSSTLVVLRDGEDGAVEVLLLKRADRGDQNSLRWVFPGGLVDETDTLVRPHVEGLDDDRASERVGVPCNGFDFWIAAMRETIEEAGILLAVDPNGRPVDDASAAEALGQWRMQSRDLPRGQADEAMASLCAAQGWRLAASRLLPLAHWITPRGLPKRFDTRFFVVVVPQHQSVSIDGEEVIDHCWCRVSELAAQRAPVAVRGPTLSVLQDLACHAALEEMLSWVRSLGGFTPVEPRLALDDQSQPQPIPPWHAAWTEVGGIDPEGRGSAYSRIRAGVPVELEAGRWVRITAPNGSVLTGPGTNSYLLRAAGDDWVLIDPGPDDSAHVDAVLAELRRRGARLTAILVTHTHVDQFAGCTGGPACHRRALRGPSGRPSNEPGPAVRTRRSAHRWHATGLRRRMCPARHPHPGPCVEPPVLSA